MMRRALSSCRLYSWMRLIWQSKMESGSTAWPLVDLSQSANCTLASRLALRNAARKAFVLGQRLELLKLLEVGDPAIADGLGNRARRERGWRAAASGGA